MKIKRKLRNKNLKYLGQIMRFRYLSYICTVLPAKSESDDMFCLQSYQGLRIDRSHVY